MYRNATDFCILIFSPATLLNSNRFSLVECLTFSIFKIMSSANRDNLLQEEGILDTGIQTPGKYRVLMGTEIESMCL